MGPHSAGRLVGELAVHRDLFSRGWSGSAAALECIVDALISNALETNPRHWSASFLPRQTSPRTDFRSNKALAGTSSASAPSTPANPCPSHPPSLPPIPAASSLSAAQVFQDGPSLSSVPMWMLAVSLPMASSKRHSLRLVPSAFSSMREQWGDRRRTIPCPRICTKDPASALSAAGWHRTKSLPAHALDSANARMKE